MTTILFVLAFGIVAVLVYMARFSGRVRVAQTREIDAPLGEVYGRVVDFSRWSEWNPWLEHEPTAEVCLSKQTDAEKSTYAWDSPRIGNGRIEHVCIMVGERIEQRVRFKQPFRVQGGGCWQFVQASGKTRVTWSFDGRVAFSLRAFAATVRATLELDFRYGLDRLASLVEPPDSPRYAIVYLGLRDVAPGRYAYRTYRGPLAGLLPAIRQEAEALRRQLAERDVAVAGVPLAMYVKTNIKLRTTVCHVCLPIGEMDAGQLPVREQPGHRAFVACLKGSHAAMEIAWYHAMQHMRIEGILPDQRIAPCERYVEWSDTVPEADHLTELYIPVRLPA